MRHESWCASLYQGEAGPGECDCRKTVVQEHTVPGSSSSPPALPDQFCLKCESAPVRLAIIRPRITDQPLRYFAACMVCGYFRELDPIIAVA